MQMSLPMFWSGLRDNFALACSQSMHTGGRPETTTCFWLFEPNCRLDLDLRNMQILPNRLAR
jgi:hypothetical protein